jgi:predicted nucleic acid-binding protein
VIVVDTSFVYALLDRRDDRHREAARWYRHVDEEIATTPMVLAETEHLARTRAGERAVTAFRNDLYIGAYLVERWPAAARQSSEIVKRYIDLDVSLTDASLVALTARLGTERITTFDERHFSHPSATSTRRWRVSLAACGRSLM